MKTLTFSALTLALVFSVSQAMAFCGFYVSKADTKLFNKASQVIMVRDGDRTVITMSNDFQGDVKDFAMVVPVPEVLKRENIRIAERKVFDQLDTYSSPRLVEYHDANPCWAYTQNEWSKDSFTAGFSKATEKKKEDLSKTYKVTVEATYTVGEYDILILSAEESTGLKAWLLDNGYKIPATAEEVLEPYIKNNLKFFVVKVNLERAEQNKTNVLNPIQIAFKSDKFMLPIRLGMANATGDQDMIVYAFTKKGRVETANYRTAQLPTDKNIPEFVESQYGQFYTSLFEMAWKREGQKAVILEYAWDLSSNNYVKCDPCVTSPPDYTTLREAGVYWVKEVGNNRTSNYNGDLFFTRLHVRYNRHNYPQDLMFSVTPNTQRFQGRYVMQRPFKGEIKCESAAQYYKQVAQRRQQEMTELANLTGWNVQQYQWYVAEYQSKAEQAQYGWIGSDFSNGNMMPPVSNNDPGSSGNGGWPPMGGGILIALFCLMGIGLWYHLRFQARQPIAA